MGVTQVIISGGIDLSSGPLVGATAMIVMSLAQTELVNGNPNSKAVFGDWAFAAIILSSKNLTTQSGMGIFYELYAIAMAVIGGVSLTGGRGSIIGTVLGAMVFGVIQSRFTYIKLDAFFQMMAMGAIIIGAVVWDKMRQERAMIKS